MQLSREFQSRVISSFLTGALVSALLFFSSKIWASFLLVFLALGIAAIASWEYAHLAKKRGIACNSWVCISAVVAQTISFFLSAALSVNQLPLIVAFLILGVIFLIHFRRPENSIGATACEFFSSIYIGVPIGLMLWILYYPNYPSAEPGVWWLFYLIAVTKSSDIGAYISGKLIGTKRLAPVLSPKKTVEGAVGGVCSSILVSLALGYAGSILSGGVFDLSFTEMVCLGFFIGVLSLFGDLAESLFKRDAQVKDTNQIPGFGFGGVLDLLDSLVFTVPLIYFYLKFQTP